MRRTVVSLVLVLTLAAAVAEPPRAPKLDLAGDPLTSGAIARMGSARLRHNAKCVAFLDTKTLVSFGDTIRTWEVATGRMKAEHRSEHMLRSVGAKFSGDGRVLIAAQNLHRFRVFDTATGKLLQELKGEGGDGDAGPGEDCHIVMSTDGRRFAVYGNEDQSIEVWRAEKGKEPTHLQMRGKHVVSDADMSPDGLRVAAALDPVDDMKDKPALTIWDVDTGKPVSTFDPKLDGPYLVEFTSDGNGVVVAGDSEWAAYTVDGKELWRGERSEAVHNIVASPDGRQIVSCELSAEGELRAAVYSATDGKLLRHWLTGLDGEMIGAVSPDSRLLAAAGPGRLRIWSLADGKETVYTEAHSNAVCTTCITPDSRYIASTDFRDKEVFLWEIATGRNVRRFSGHTAGCIEIVTSPDGKLLASSSYDRTVHIWEIATGKQLLKLEGFAKPAWHLRFLPDNQTLAVAPFSGQGVTLLHCATGKKVHEMSMSEGFRLSSLLRHPDGRILAIDSAPNTSGGAAVQVWDVITSRLVRRFEGHAGQLVCSVLSPDGRTVATRGDDGLIRLWELTTGEERANLNEEKAVQSTATQFFTFSPDGRTIASVNRRETRVYLWDVPRGQQFASFEAHTRPMYTVEYSPDGRSLLTGSQDATLLAWDMTTADRRSRPLPGGRLTQAQLEEQWVKLRNGTAAEAYGAKWAFAGDPETTIAFLRGRFEAPKRVAPEKIKSWVADLDSPKYVTREAAERGLSSALDQAEPDMRQALPKSTGEARRRLTRILGAALIAVPPPDLLRELRAVEILDQIGANAALDLLRELTPEKVRARVAAEAAVTLKRLEPARK